MAAAERPYLPAAGSDWLLPLYDPFTRLLGTESVHRQLLDQARIQPGHRVLEIGCGTGSLTVLAKRRCPEAALVGLDPDPKALERARRKAERAAVSIQLDRGFADELSYGDGTFDRVLSAFMLHHLEPDQKKAALREARRVLAPGGSMHVVDFAGGSAHGGGLAARLFHRHEGTAGHDSLSTLLREAGFEDPVETIRKLVFFRIGFYRASSLRHGCAPGVERGPDRRARSE